MGVITSRRAPAPRSPRPSACPADVDQRVWFAAHHSLQHDDRVTLDDLLDDDDRSVRADPTPDEIEAASAEIRSTWSPSETRRRRITLLDPLTATVISISDLIGATGGE